MVKGLWTSDSCHSYYLRRWFYMGYFLICIWTKIRNLNSEMVDKISESNHWSNRRTKYFIFNVSWEISYAKAWTYRSLIIRYCICLFKVRWRMMFCLGIYLYVDRTSCLYELFKHWYLHYIHVPFDTQTHKCARTVYTNKKARLKKMTSCRIVTENSPKPGCEGTFRTRHA